MTETTRSKHRVPVLRHPVEVIGAVGGGCQGSGELVSGGEVSDE